MKRIYHGPWTLAGLACAILAAVAMLSFFSCGEKGQASSNDKPHMDNKDLKTIYLAGGCFWGVEKYFSLMPGVKETEAGYANGSTASPTYEEVCSGKTGHAETVKVVFDPEELSLPFLLERYYSIIDPVSVNKQGNDRGIQYRTGIYYADEKDKPVIETSLKGSSSTSGSLWQLKFSPSANFHGRKNIISAIWIKTLADTAIFHPPNSGKRPRPAKTNLFTGKNRTKSCAAS